jgi:hypothetical protein
MSSDVRRLVRPLSTARIVLINVVVTLCLLELSLRVQQRIGPLIDLDLRPEAILVGLSDEVNHVHLPWSDWDSNGIRRMDEPNSEACTKKLLFMGDSFMEGLGRRETVPYHVRRFFAQHGKDICVFNAGVSSYSPSIFIVLAKRLIPLLKPDVVIIDVDETDIYDDWYRYRQLVTRDDAGSITAVRRSPFTARFQQGLVDSTSKTLYVHRLIAKVYFTGIEYPRFFARYTRDWPPNMLALAMVSPADARKQYAAQIDYFVATLDDLTQTVVRRVGSRDNLVYIHHPHLEHLKSGGAAFNDVVSTTLREVAARHGVRYYDAVDDLKAEFGKAPESYYIPNDVHFNAAGQQAYGIAVARYLAGTAGPTE